MKSAERSQRSSECEELPAAPLIESLRKALAAGDIDAAVGLCEARLQADRNDADAHRHLGQLRALSAEHLPALRSAMRACELAPDDPRSWSDLGRAHALAGELHHAARCFVEAVDIDERCADGWHNLGNALKKLGQREPAFAALKQALLLDPRRPQTYVVLGNLLIETDQLEDALECFERAARLDPTMARARTLLADQMSVRGRVKRTEMLFRQSLTMDPNQIEAWIGLARTLEDIGEAEGARNSYANVLRRRPDHALALGNYLALSPEETAQDAESGAWRDHAQATLTDAATADEARALIGYGLAKYHDRRRNYEQAARAGSAANLARRRSAGPLDREALAARVSGIIHTYTAVFFASRRRYGVGNDQPVLIVELPRSGTTLTEQILSAHPRLHGAGELPDLARLAARIDASDSGEPWQAAARIDAEMSRTLAGAYLQALRANAPAQRLRYSDKSPLNFFQLAFAALLFPNARVVHCRRSLRDTALSTWMENFNVEQRYATDFDDLAFFCAQYERLMAHWREALPVPMLELQYEQTIADLEGQARRLIDFLGVPWDPRCLDFHRSERAVQTPSRWQVRQPLYAHSVGRWRHYAEYLPELLHAFPDRGGETPP